MIRAFLLLISISIFSYNSSGQNVDKYDYHPPLKIPLILSSNFGELRPNHFHMGLDFKTNNKIGYRLYSIEEGFVSRIKVSPYGYGKVIYIDHPNGMTSVYAHCSEFKGEIDSIVQATQKKEQKFAVEIFPGKNIIKVQKGQVIGISGNTGGSTAPHLHFEIRETKTEHALNPLKFGFDIEDSKAPEIRGIKIYALTKDGYRFPNKASFKRAVKGQNGYYIGNDEIVIPSNYLTKTGGLGFAADVIDRFDGASNRCGLYGSYLIIDGDTLFGQKIDRVPFESTRYVNSHKDYEDYQKLSRKLHKSFKTSENDLPIYVKEGNGIITAKPGDVKNVLFVAFDAKGNKSELKFKLKISKGAINTIDAIPVGEHSLHPLKSSSYKSENTELEFGITSVYEPITFDHDKAEYQILKGSIPVNRTYKIKKKIGDNDGKYYLEIISNKGRKKNIHAEYDRGWLIMESKYFGSYKLRRDTIPPTITPLNFSTTITKKTMTWRISDRHSGLADYGVFIEGEWHLLEYEYKGGGTMTFTRPKGLSGKKKVLVRATDDCGNSKEWTRTVVFN